jgi:hypothetical protein
MVNICKGTCIRFKAIGYKGRRRYEDGQKSVKLRSTPRGNKSRKEIHEKRKCVWH